jgi:hypothetical protein
MNGSPLVFLDPQLSSSSTIWDGIGGNAAEDRATTWIMILAQCVEWSTWWNWSIFPSPLVHPCDFDAQDAQHQRVHPSGPLHISQESRGWSDPSWHITQLLVHYTPPNRRQALIHDSSLYPRHFPPGRRQLPSPSGWMQDHALEFILHAWNSNMPLYPSPRL